MARDEAELAQLEAKAKGAEGLPRAAARASSRDEAAPLVAARARAVRARAEDLALAPVHDRRVASRLCLIAGRRIDAKHQAPSGQRAKARAGTPAAVRAAARAGRAEVEVVALLHKAGALVLAGKAQEKEKEAAKRRTEAGALGKEAARATEAPPGYGGERGLPSRSCAEIDKVAARAEALGTVVERARARATDLLARAKLEEEAELALVRRGIERLVVPRAVPRVADCGIEARLVRLFEVGLTRIGPTMLGS